jgi:enamine deaminase RidA (YjgF/YER057c/UK114 family)
MRFSPVHRRILLAAPLVLASAASAAEIKRVAIPNSHFPILAAVEVPAGATTLYVSGMGADVADAKAPAMTLAAYGDTEAQTTSALTKIGKFLTDHGYDMGDVVMMHAYLVADPAKGKMDFPGFMKGYTKFFGTAGQPHLPSRSAFQIAALGNPGWLVEIEVIAAKSK